MDSLQWYDYMRMLTCLLCIASFYLLAERVRNMWNQSTDYLRDLWWVLFAFLFLMIEGNLEQIVEDVGWGARTLLGFIISLICFKAMLNRNKLYTNNK